MCPPYKFCNLTGLKIIHGEFFPRFYVEQSASLTGRRFFGSASAFAAAFGSAPGAAF